MNALIQTHPPPLTCNNTVTVTSENDSELHELWAFIEEHEVARFPKFRFQPGKLIIVFKVAPDTIIKNLIENDVHRICNDATITWEVTNYEDTTS